jgi:hypothetical protein
MRGIVADDERHLKERLFAFARLHTVPPNDLRSVSGVPIEADGLRKKGCDVIGHGEVYTGYIRFASLPVVCRGDEGGLGFRLQLFHEARPSEAVVAHIGGAAEARVHEGEHRAALAIRREQEGDRLSGD